jgi:hypothetical protein
MTAKYTYNAADEPVNLEYEKKTHCTEKCIWFSDSVVPSIHSQWITQTSSLSKQTYTYDTVARLTEAQDTPAGKDCASRLYGYDEDTNRTSLTTRESTTTECLTTGGTTENHTYDNADRLNDAGITYDAWGNIAKLPAADAGGNELASTFYTNDRLATQTQNGETINYNLDPALRTRDDRTILRVLHTRDPRHRRRPRRSPEQHRNPRTPALGPPWRYRRYSILKRNGNQAALQHRHHRVRRPDHQHPAKVRVSRLRRAPDRTIIRCDRAGRPLLHPPARTLPTDRPDPRRLGQRLPPASALCLR